MKSLQLALREKFGEKFSKIIDSEILNAINRMGGSSSQLGKTSPMRKGLDLDEIEDRINKKIFTINRSPKPNKYQYDLSYKKPDLIGPEADHQVYHKTAKKFGIANAGVPHTL